MANWDVGPIMDKFINACSDYLQDENGWQGMKEELERLRENHFKVQDVVSASTKPQSRDRNPALDSWIWRLRDVIDEANDVLDDLEYMKLKEQLTINKKKQTVMDPNLKKLEAVVKKLDQVSAEVSNFIPQTICLCARVEAGDVLDDFDPEIQTLDAGLQQRNNSDWVINIQHPSSSPNDMNHLVRRTLEIKKVKWKNSEMPKLAKDYFENSELTSNLLTFLKTSLEKAGDSQLMGELAVKSFYQEDAVAAAVAADVDDQPPEVSWKMRYVKTLDELSRFKAIGDPFTDEFYITFQSVYHQPLSMLEKLHIQELKQEKNLKSVKIRRKVSWIIFISVFMALLISCFVLALKASQRLAAAMTVVISLPLLQMGKWFDSMWKDYQDALQTEKELIDTMHARTSDVHTDLDGTKILVKQLRDSIRWLLNNLKFVLHNDPNFVFENEDVVRLSIEKLSKMIEGMKIIQGLVKQCGGRVKQASIVVFEQIEKLHK